MMVNNVCMHACMYVCMYVCTGAIVRSEKGKECGLGGSPRSREEDL